MLFFGTHNIKMWHRIGGGDCLLKTQDMLNSNMMYIVWYLPGARKLKLMVEICCWYKLGVNGGCNLDGPK